MGNKIVEALSALNTSSKKVLEDILLMNFTVVNAVLVGDKDEWVLVDTGLENSGDFIDYRNRWTDDWDNINECITKASSGKVS